MSEDTDRILAQLAELGIRINELRTETVALRTDLTAEIRAVREEVLDVRVDAMARLDRLQDSVTQMQDEISVSLAGTDRARLVHDHTREELRGLTDHVAALHRKINRIESEIRTLRGET